MIETHQQKPGCPLLEFIKQKNAEVNETKTAVVESTHRMLLISISLGVVAVVIGACIAIWLARNVMQQLGGEPDCAAKTAHRIASGDFSAKIETTSGDSSSLLYKFREFRSTWPRGCSKSVRVPIRLRWPRRKLLPAIRIYQTAPKSKLIRSAVPLRR